MASTSAEKKLYTISEAALALGRSPQTVRRLEKRGVLPPAVRQHGQRRYSPSDIASLREAAEVTGFLDQPWAADQLRAHLSGGPHSTTMGITPPRAWRDIEPEPQVRTWAEISGEVEPESRIAKLPTNCPICGRALVRRAITDPHGRRWLIALCNFHD
jgi:hypothetical protein